MKPVINLGINNFCYELHMPSSLLSKYITHKRILLKLISMRCDCADKYQKMFVVDSLNGKHKAEAKNPDNQILYDIFPPRRQWVHISAAKRECVPFGSTIKRKLNQHEKKELNLRLTVYKEADKSEHADWYMRLEKYIADIIRLANDKYFAFHTPNTFGCEKKRDVSTHEIEVRPICQFCTVEERIIVSLYNKALTNLFEPYFYEKSFAFRVPPKDKAKTTLPHLNAIREITQFRKSHGAIIWVAECDMKKFYDTIDHAIIKQCFMVLLQRCKKDGLISNEEFKQIQRVMFSYIDCYSFYQDIYRHNDHPEDEFWKGIKGKGYTKKVKWVEEDIKSACATYKPYPGKDYYKHHLGVPQGGALSGLIANIVMHCVDQKLHEFYEHPDFLYLRFCDDMIMMSPNKERLSQAFEVYRDAVKYLHLYIHEDTPMAFAHARDFWKGKTRSPYQWGAPGSSDVMPWITFVGFDINWMGDTRIRKSTYQKEIKKQYEKCQEVKKLLSDAKHPPLRHSSFIESSVTKRLIGMSVGRVPLWDYVNFENDMSWAQAFTELTDNPWARRQLKDLDCHRKRMLAQLKKFLHGLDYSKSKVVGEDENRSTNHIYYGKPYSYYGQILK